MCKENLKTAQTVCKLRRASGETITSITLPTSVFDFLERHFGDAEKWAGEKYDKIRAEQHLQGKRPTQREICNHIRREAVDTMLFVEEGL